MSEGHNQLLPLGQATKNKKGGYGATTSSTAYKPSMAMQTYTAGEDSSRLAEMAKEFGLERQRQARQNVRDRVPVPLFQLNSFVVERILDPSFADIRMRSIYTSHGDLDDDEEGKSLLNRLPSWKEDSTQHEGDDGADLDPHAHGMGGDLVSAVLGIIKGMVGPAILYLPHGFANAGWVCAIPILLFSTVLFLSSSACLLDSWKLESEKAKMEAMSPEGGKKKRTILSYPELAYRALGSTGENIVKIGIAAMQSGVCLTYLIFVPQNLHASTLQLFDMDIPPSYFMTVMLVCQIPMSWIRDIRKLTITNLLANLLILYGLITCLGFALSNAIDSPSGRGPLAEMGYKLTHLEAFNSGWFLFIGTSVSDAHFYLLYAEFSEETKSLLTSLFLAQVLLFEGSITLLVPLQEAVYREEDREKFPFVYRRVILGIITFYTFFGIFCWMSFGEDVKTVMTTSLPEGNLATSVQLAYSFAVIFTFPLQNFPSLEIACRSIAGAMQSCCGRTVIQSRNLIASVLVCLLAVVAISTMESLDKVVSLMGSLLGCPLAFVFPPLIHNNLDDNLSGYRRFTNNFIAGLGLFAMILASFTTLLTW